MLDVRNGTDGRIYLGDEELTQAKAIETATLLVCAVQRSIDRNQIGTPRYTDSEQILARQNAPLGRALKALLDLEFEGVRKAWLAS
jgi:hypothetical protein